MIHVAKTEQRAFIQIRQLGYFHVENISTTKTFSAKAVIKSFNGVLDAGCNFKNENLLHPHSLMVSELQETKKIGEILQH